MSTVGKFFYTVLVFILVVSIVGVAKAEDDSGDSSYGRHPFAMVRVHRDRGEATRFLVAMVRFALGEGRGASISHRLNHGDLLAALGNPSNETLRGHTYRDDGSSEWGLICFDKIVPRELVEMSYLPDGSGSPIWEDSWRDIPAGTYAYGDLKAGINIDADCGNVWQFKTRAPREVWHAGRRVRILREEEPHYHFVRGVAAPMICRRACLSGWMPLNPPYLAPFRPFPIFAGAPMLGPVPIAYNNTNMQPVTFVDNRSNVDNRGLGARYINAPTFYPPRPTPPSYYLPQSPQFAGVGPLHGQGFPNQPAFRFARPLSPADMSFMPSPNPPGQFYPPGYGGPRLNGGVPLGMANPALTTGGPRFRR